MRHQIYCDLWGHSFSSLVNHFGFNCYFFFSFLFSRATFLVAESCLIAGAKKNAYHTKYRGIIYAQNFSCESLRKGIFITGAIFIVVTMVLNVYYYMYFTKATTTPLSQKTNRVSSTIGMTGHAWLTLDEYERVTNFESSVQWMSLWFLLLGKTVVLTWFLLS